MGGLAKFPCLFSKPTNRTRPDGLRAKRAGTYGHANLDLFSFPYQIMFSLYFVFNESLPTQPAWLATEVMRLCIGTHENVVL
ncbi:hypothetical protein SDJN02_15649, partial [Cucurbita argyrosperma subsp. argyrosperma]